MSAIKVSDFGAHPNDGQDDRAGFQAAIDAAHDGDTIFFGDGVYNIDGQISLKSNINITSENALGADLEFSVRVNPGDVNGDNYAFRSLWLENFSFTNLKVRSNNGIFFFQDTSNTRFTDNDFIWGWGGNYYNRLAFYASGRQDRMRIEENYFHDSPNSDRNVEIWGMADSSYSYNRFHNVNDGGHIMEPRSNVNVSFNRGTKIHRMGIEIQGHNATTGLVVEGNIMTDWDRPWNDTFGLSVMMMNSPDTKIINNFISSDFSGDWGVSSAGAGGPRFGLGIEAGLSGGVVSGNEIGGPNPWAAAVAVSQKNTLVRNNRFFGDALWGNIIAEPGTAGLGSFINRDNDRHLKENMPPAKKLKAGPSVMTGVTNSIFASADNGTSTNPNPASNNDDKQDQDDKKTSPPIIGGLISVTEAVADAKIDDAGDVYLSDLAWTSALSGWGDVEKDASNGERRGGDGGTLSVGGKSYKKGLGVAIDSQIVYDLAGKYSKFFSDIGIDDEVRHKGSMTFQVWADGKKIYDSGVLRGSDEAAKSLELDVAGVKELKLVTTSADDGENSDHGDWAAARLQPAEGAATPDPVFTPAS